MWAMPSSSRRANSLARSAAIDAGVVCQASTKVLILGIFVAASVRRRSYGHRWDDQLQRPECLQARTGWVWQERKCGPDRGCSSGVEHNLAKVGVVGSNPFARSNKINDLSYFQEPLPVAVITC